MIHRRPKNFGQRQRVPNLAGSAANSKINANESTLSNANPDLKTVQSLYEPELTTFDVNPIILNTVAQKPMAYNCPYETCSENRTNWADIKAHLESAHPEYSGYGIKVASTKPQSDDDSDSEEEVFQGKRARQSTTACPECGKWYTGNNLHKHMRLVHCGPDNVPVHCDLCNKSFNHEEYMWAHEKTIGHRRRLEEKKRQESGQSAGADDLSSMLSELENECFSPMWKNQ